MRHRHLFLAAMVGAAALAPPALSLAAEGLSFGGQAPVVCRAAIEGQELSEFCNDPSGYEVWIDYPAELASATLVVGEQRLPLTDAGSVRVTSANSPQITVRAISLEGAQVTQGLLLGVRVRPSGSAEGALAAR